MATALTELSSRTTAACVGCTWTSDRLTGELTIRVASRQHADTTGHCVAVLTNTITVLVPGQVAPPMAAEKALAS